MSSLEFGVRVLDQLPARRMNALLQRLDEMALATAVRSFGIGSAGSRICRT